MAVAYLPLAGHPPGWRRSVLKTAPLVLFAFGAFLMDGPAWLVAALAFSAAGDFALSREGRMAFLYGLASFSLAHLFYILLFISMTDQSPWEAFSDAPVAAIAVVLLALSSEVWLQPHPGSLAWPVRGYIVLITLMALAALTVADAVVVAGAGFFLVSDLVLAIQLFRLSSASPLYRPAGWLLWSLYVAGQALILIGIAG